MARDLANPLAPTYGSNKPKKVKKLKEVKVNPVGRYTDKKQSMSKAKKQAKNFSKNENTGYAAKVTPKKVKTITYKDGKKVKTTVAKDGKLVREKGKEVRLEKRKAAREKKLEKKIEKRIERIERRNTKR